MKEKIAKFFISEGLSMNISKNLIKFIMIMILMTSNNGQILIIQKLRNYYKNTEIHMKPKINKSKASWGEINTIQLILNNNSNNNT